MHQFELDKNFLASKGVWGSIGSIVVGAILALDPLTAQSGLAVLGSGLLSLWGRISAKSKIKLF